MFPDQIFLCKRSLISFSLVRISASPLTLYRTPGLDNLPDILPCALMDSLILLSLATHPISQFGSDWIAVASSSFPFYIFSNPEAYPFRLELVPALGSVLLINANWNAFVQAYIISWQGSHNRCRRSVYYPHWKQTFILEKKTIIFSWLTGFSWLLSCGRRGFSQNAFLGIITVFFFEMVVGVL